jgi:hypothetical protein
MNMKKNWIGDRTFVTTRILAASIGLIAIGYPSFADAATQQPIHSNNSSNIATVSEKNYINNLEISSTIDTSIQKVQVSLENHANASEKLPLQKGMTYKEARQIVIKQGWRPNLQGEPNLSSLAVKNLFDLGYIEIKDCAGTGEGPCRFEFINQQGELLVVVTAGRDSLVRNWWIEKNPDSDRQKSSSNIIEEGRYWLGGTDRGLEVKGGRYRYYDESDIDRPWKPISELQYIKKGVVFDGKDYWCLSTIAPKNRATSCSKNGW